MAAVVPGASSAFFSDFAYGEYTPELKKKLEELIDIIFKSSYYLLLLDKSAMEARGYEVKVLHPLTTWLIFLEPQNIEKIRAIMNNILFIPLRGHFINGQIVTFVRRKSDVLNHLDDFAKDAHLNVEELRPFVERNEWEAFMRHLII